MKKTLVAIAALVAVGAVSAQSSVTLYGRLDAAVGKNEVKVGGTALGAAALAGTRSDPGWNVNSGNVSGSRWGMRGTEDLGGGMKANFVLESGYSLDTGTSAQGGRLFGRNAYVGVSGGFGDIRLGRQVTFMADFGWAITGGYANYDAWAVNTGFGNKGSIAEDVVRKDNSISYRTPSMGGLTAGLMIAPGENGVPGGASNSTYYSGVIDFKNGPLQANLTYERDDTNAAGTPTPGGTSQTQWVLGGKYDLGPAALALSVQRAKVLNVKDTGWAVGVTAPMGPVTLALEYARERSENSGTFAGRANALNLRAIYALSKRTDVYAFLSDGKSRTALGGTQDLSRYALGVRHTF